MPRRWRALRGVALAGALLFVSLHQTVAAHSDEETRIDVGGPLTIFPEGTQPSEHYEFVFPKTIKSFYVPRTSYWRAHEVITKFRTELVVEVTEVSGCPLYVFTKDSLRSHATGIPYEAWPAPTDDSGDRKEKRWILHLSPLGDAATVNVACSSEKNDLARLLKKKILGSLPSAVRRGAEGADKDKENVFYITVVEQRNNKYPQFLAAGVAALLLSGPLARSVSFFYLTSVASVVAVLTLLVVYLAYRSMGRSDRHRTRAVGRGLGLLFMGVAYVANRGAEAVAAWYTKAVVWPLQQMYRYAFSNQPGSGYVFLLACVIAALSAGAGAAITRRYLVEASSEGTRVKGGAQTFVLWVLRTAAALMLTQSWSDPWVGSALAVVVYSVITGWLYSVARSAQHAAQTTAHVAQIALSPLQGLRSPASAAKASARRPADGRGGPLASPRATPRAPPSRAAQKPMGSPGSVESLDPEPDRPPAAVRRELFFGRTPLSAAEAERVTKRTTELELKRLCASPEFIKYVAENSGRMSFSPPPRGVPGRRGADESDYESDGGSESGDE